MMLKRLGCHRQCPPQMLRLVSYFLLALTALSVQAQQRDPTRPPMTSAQTIELNNSLPTINSIHIGATMRRATLNGTAVQIGDRYGVFDVVAIEPNTVVLKNAEQEISIRMYPMITEPSGFSVESERESGFEEDTQHE